MSSGLATERETASKESDVRGVKAIKREGEKMRKTRIRRNEALSGAVFYPAGSTPMMASVYSKTDIMQEKNSLFIYTC
jgi:hypothetical protein